MFFKRLFFIYFLLLVSSYSTSHAMDVYDETGQKISLHRHPQRIISLAPDISELLFAIGAGPQIVGVIDGSDYPPELHKIPLVGSYQGLDLERIIRLKPDLIVTWDHLFARQLSVLKKLGIAVYATRPKHLGDIAYSMRKLALLTGHQRQGEMLANVFSKRLKLLTDQKPVSKKIRVFYQLGPYGTTTINRESWINEAISLCGGENIFANSKFSAPRVSLEAVVVANPQVIISGAKNDNWKQIWSEWPSVNAVHNHKLISIDSDLLERAGPRLMDGVELLCQRMMTPDVQRRRSI